jgi:Zn-dependent protease
MHILSSVPAGSIMRTPIRIHWSVPMGFILWEVFSLSDLDERSSTGIFLLLAPQIIFISALISIVLIHELAHAMTARIWDVRTRGIYLHVFGGLTLFASPGLSELRPLQKIVVYAAGPASNLLCYAMAALLLRVIKEPVFTGIFGLFAGMNLWIGIFNLLPIWPLDG